ncbi:MAG: hypothetical protein ACT4QD_13555 [Acidobacteriota bacterium]
MRCRHARAPSWVRPRVILEQAHEIASRRCQPAGAQPIVVLTTSHSRDHLCHGEILHPGKALPNNVEALDAFKVRDDHLDRRSTDLS